MERRDALRLLAGALGTALVPAAPFRGPFRLIREGGQVYEGPFELNADGHIVGVPEGRYTVDFGPGYERNFDLED